MPTLYQHYQARTNNHVALALLYTATVFLLQLLRSSATQQQIQQVTILTQLNIFHIFGDPCCSVLATTYIECMKLHTVGLAHMYEYISMPINIVHHCTCMSVATCMTSLGICLFPNQASISSNNTNMAAC